MSRASLLQFKPRTLLLATLAIAVVLVTVVWVPQYSAREARLGVLRLHVDQVARLAASVVDGDLHRQLMQADGDDPALRRQALAPLLRLHEHWPEAIYVYTMAVRDDGTPYFVLDTAQDAAFAAARGLRGSRFGEAFHLRSEYASNWLDELAAGRSYVNAGFQHDDYGYFLSGHAPIRDSAGRVAGFAGVDFDLAYYLSEETRFHRIEAVSVLGALLLSLAFGYAYARHRHAHEAELRQHVETSMQDALTTLPNRRGAMAAIDAVWRAGGGAKHAALLVDIDDFKSINDSGGHATGDAVIEALAAALRAALRPGDLAARLGGDEFLIFARDCDEAGAEAIAARLLQVVRSAHASPVRFGVSVGISVTTTADGDFDRLYRQADAALYRAKREGRDRYALFVPA